MRVRLRSKLWNIGFRHPGRNMDGVCCYETRRISIRTNLDEQRELDVTIHELLHACYPDLDEEAVAETATDIAAVLTKLGWRKDG